MTHSTNTPQTDKVWFITGASTGFGRLLAEEVLKSGGKVIATARKLDQIADLEQKYPQKAKALALDVTDSGPGRLRGSSGDCPVRPHRCPRQQRRLRRRRRHRRGHRRQSSCRCSTPMSSASSASPEPFCRSFRKQRSGHILNLSSIGGLDSQALAGDSIRRTKFAVEGLSEALAAGARPAWHPCHDHRARPFRTDFLGRSGVEAETKIPDYDTTAGNARRYMTDQNGKQRGDPQRAVQAMIQVVESPNPPLRLLLGASALQRLRAKLDNWQKEIAAWEYVTVGADFPEGQ